MPLSLPPSLSLPLPSLSLSLFVSLMSALHISLTSCQSVRGCPFSSAPPSSLSPLTLSLTRSDTTLSLSLPFSVPPYLCPLKSLPPSLSTSLLSTFPCLLSLFLLSLSPPLCLPLHSLSPLSVSSCPYSHCASPPSLSLPVIPLLPRSLSHSHPLSLSLPLLLSHSVSPRLLPAGYANRYPSIGWLLIDPGWRLFIGERVAVRRSYPRANC